MRRTFKICPFHYDMFVNSKSFVTFQRKCDNDLLKSKVQYILFFMVGIRCFCFDVRYQNLYSKGNPTFFLGQKKESFSEPKIVRKIKTVLILF
jgi:hypothetical protein